MYTILVVGGGGREHAIIKKLRQNDSITTIFAAPGNGGIACDATCVNIKATDIEGIVTFAKQNAVDFCIVGPDDPLVLGMVDALQAVGIPTFGPNKAAAILEGSKVFSKQLMLDYNIPTAAYKAFDNAQLAIDYITTQNTFPIVIKADGLALGKGVIIAKDLETAVAGINSIMEDKIFGDSGSSVVIEEFLVGVEVSVLALCDSHTIVPLTSAMDHKRALDGDNGLNTGGMGTIAPNPFFTKKVSDECMETIFKPTMQAMNSMNRPFKGIIFFGLMITNSGTKVIEYNCRFGDPEAQVVIPLLKSDLLDIFQAVVDQRLCELKIEFEDSSAACVILASGGYPQAYTTGLEITGLDKNGQVEGATVFHSGTAFSDGSFKTAGGRVIGISALGENLPAAINSAYRAAENIQFSGKYCRKDIGALACTYNSEYTK